MKILTFHQNWLTDELRELGHEVLTCGHTASQQVCLPKRVVPIQELLRSLGGFSPDVLLFLDDSMPALLISGLDTCDIPSVFYSVDSHQHYQVHPLIAPLFDHVLVAQRDYLPSFVRRGTPVSWFPLWAPRHVEPAPVKRYPATFVGTLNPHLNPRRVAFFEALTPRIPIHVTPGKWWEIFPEAEIVVNQTVKGDLNFRVFEAMMCGSLLLTERTSNGLLELFKDGRHLVTYTPDNVEEVVETVRSLSADPRRIAEIASAGRAEILQRHTSMHRAIALDGILRNVKKAPRHPRQHYVSLANNAIINNLLHQQNQAPCLHAVSAAILAGEAGLQMALPPTERETTFLIATCDLYDRLTATRIGAHLINKFQESYPANNLLTLAHINNLIAQGQESAALRVAAQRFQADPTQACHMAMEFVPRITRGEIQLPPD